MVPSSAPRGAPVGRAHGHTTGLPVLPLSSSFVHAIVTTPAEPVGACFAHFPIDDSLPRVCAGSASALPISRPAQRSLALRPARSPNPLKDLLHRRLQPLRYLHDCSDCFRLERQLPGGIRTRGKTAPFHGAHKLGLGCHVSRRHRRATPASVGQHRQMNKRFSGPGCEWPGRTSLASVLASHLRIAKDPIRKAAQAARPHVRTRS